MAETRKAETKRKNMNQRNANQKYAETKSAAKKRRKRRKAGKNFIQNKLAMISISFVVCVLFFSLLFLRCSLQEQVEKNDARISQLQEQYQAEQERTEEIEELQEYMQSDEYIEKYAKEKIGLVKENEIIFKENK